MEQFKKVFSVAVLVVGLLLVGKTAPAMAAPPIIDGVMGATEWDAFLILAPDPNEGVHLDQYDFSEIRGLNDPTGTYFLVRTYAAPSLVDFSPGSPTRAAISIALDYNGNGLFTDAVDRSLFHTALADGTGQTFEVRNGLGTLLLSGVEGTHFKLGSVVEYFVPLGSGGDPIPSTLKGFAEYQDGGGAADDQLPDEGYFQPSPEPTSLSLLGFGLLGLLGTSLRRRLF